MGRRKSSWGALLRGLFLPAASVAAAVCFATALDSLDRGRDGEDLRQLEEALRRCCVACYAAEGVYPPSVDYLKERYGLQVDEERYSVHYTIFASNLMPDITVLEIEP